MNDKHAILKAHIENVNAKTDAGFVTNPAHWDNKIYQVDTPAKFDHWLNVETLFEVIQSKLGYKANFADLKAMSDEQILVRLNELSAK